MNKVYVMCGCPGSGKSFRAKQLAPDCCIVSADKYWLNCVGDYLFIPSKLSLAHNWCFSEFERLLKEGKSRIVVDNCNILKKHRQPYIDLAKTYNYEAEIILPTSSWFMEIYPRIKNKTFTDDDVQIFFEKNTHNVPFDTIKKMMYNWEE